MALTPGPRRSWSVRLLDLGGAVIVFVVQPAAVLFFLGAGLVGCLAALR